MRLPRLGHEAGAVACRWRWKPTSPGPGPFTFWGLPAGRLPPRRGPADRPGSRHRAGRRSLTPRGGRPGGAEADRGRGQAERPRAADHHSGAGLNLDDAYFTACGTGRSCCPAGPEAARGFRATQAMAMTTAVTTAGTTGAYECACLSITSPRKAPAAMPTMEATRRRAEYAVSDQVTRPLNRSM